MVYNLFWEGDVALSIESLKNLHTLLDLVTALQK